MCITMAGTDPIAIFNHLLQALQVPMLGCHHAFLTAGAILAAVKNQTPGRVAQDLFNEVFLRVEKQAISGYCGLTGICGVAPAVGACFSVLSGARCGTDREQRMTMRVTRDVCSEIAGLTGPSCCKAYAWRALEIAGPALSREMGICLPAAPDRTVCRYSTLHPHGCRQSRCPYFSGKGEDDVEDGDRVVYREREPFAASRD